MMAYVCIYSELFLVIKFVRNHPVRTEGWHHQQVFLRNKADIRRIYFLVAGVEDGLDLQIATDKMYLPSPSRYQVMTAFQGNNAVGTFHALRQCIDRLTFKVDRKESSSPVGCNQQFRIADQYAVGTVKCVGFDKYVRGSVWFYPKYLIPFNIGGIDEPLRIYVNPVQAFCISHFYTLR